MQNITIKTFLDTKRIKSEFNIGEHVFVIDYDLSIPTIIEGYILAIGVSSPFQIDDLIYFIDRSIRQKEEYKRYYIRDIFKTKSLAASHLAEELREYAKKLELLASISANPKGSQ